MSPKSKPTPAEVFRPERLRLARQRAALTQEELSQLCGVGKRGRRVSAWETGANVPSITHVRALAKALGVSSDWLLGLVDDRTAHFAEITPAVGALLNELAEFNQAEIKEILRAVRTLKRSRTG